MFIHMRGLSYSNNNARARAYAPGVDSSILQCYTCTHTQGEALVKELRGWMEDKMERLESKINQCNAINQDKRRESWIVG